MDSTALLARFRLDTNDLNTPYLWSDAEVYSYIDEAQKMFCRLQGGIADATTASITTLSVTAGDVWASISPKILKLRFAQRGDQRDVRILNFEDIQSGRDGLRLDLAPGPLQCIVVGMERDKLRFLPIPVANDTLQLTVYRLPLNDINANGQALEIDEIHHVSLLDWVKARAYQKQDSDTFDRGKATEFENRFRMYCEQARQERERREHKYREILYGGY